MNVCSTRLKFNIHVTFYFLNFYGIYVHLELNLVKWGLLWIQLFNLVSGYAYYGEYPLAFACCFGNREIYDYLLDHGADPDYQDSFGNTVLHMAVIANQVVSAVFKTSYLHICNCVSTCSNLCDTV